MDTERGSQNVLHEDLNGGEHYGLTDDTRDRLLAHARQDASHSVLLSMAILRSLTHLKIIGAIIIFVLFELARHVGMW